MGKSFSRHDPDEVHVICSECGGKLYSISATEYEENKAIVDAMLCAECKKWKKSQVNYGRR